MELNWVGFRIRITVWFFFKNGTQDCIFLWKCNHSNFFLIEPNQVLYRSQELPSTDSWLEWNNSHQCTSSGWGCSSRFGDEPKTHPLALPRDFSAPFSAPKFSPPTYFPPYYLPLPSYLPPSPHFLLTPSPKLRRAHELE